MPQSGADSQLIRFQEQEPPRTIRIEGPVLLLIGPLGIFFSRLARHLESRGVPVWKVAFPLHEFGFPDRQRLAYRGKMAEFRAFLEQQIREKSIRHIFMYGDFLAPHQIAISLINDLNSDSDREHSIDAWVFELGYIRPNYVSLERDRVNARSSLNKPASFYHSLPAAQVIRQARRETGIRWRKCWKTPTFILHALTNYSIIEGPHKLQPRPSYLLAQYIGFLRKYLYLFSERSQRRRLLDGTPYFLVPLQVASDSQVLTSSDYQGMEPFITELISSFARHGHRKERLAFKHHPRDRGYNHYGRLIQRLSRQHGLADRVIYFHDGVLGTILKRARAVVTINSTVGLQALYHAVPTKVMGRTFYNLPGLTDQQDLATFWRNPQPSDRELFRKFYNHLLDTTQINGNFDGRFPFQDTFTIAPGLAVHAEGPRPAPLGVALRLLSLGQACATYLLQLLLLTLGARRSARNLLERSARQALRGLGVRVLMDRRVEPVNRPQIHIANHGHPLDALLVQGYFRNCSIAHPTRQLQRWLPFFNLSVRNYGHLRPGGRASGRPGSQLRGLMQLLRRGDHLFLYANDSQATDFAATDFGATDFAAPDIAGPDFAGADVPLSLVVLARRCDALVIPWYCLYRGFALAEEWQRFRPLALIAGRLFGPEATILCREGAPIDPRHYPGNTELAERIRVGYEQQRHLAAAVPSLPRR